MFDHQAEVLHDLDSGARELFGYGVVSYARLKPDRVRSRGEYVFDVRRYVLRASEDINHVYTAGYVGELSIDLEAEYVRRLWIVDGHGDDFESGRDQILRDVEGRLILLPLGLHA